MQDLVIEVHKYLSKNECERSQLVCRQWKHCIPSNMKQRRQFNVELTINGRRRTKSPVLFTKHIAYLYIYSFPT
jgi:hypothetical protein